MSLSSYEQITIALSELAHVQGQLEGFAEIMNLVPSTHPSVEQLLKIANRIHKVRTKIDGTYEEPKMLKPFEETNE